MPRKPGTLNKRSQKLLHQLENDHKFYVVNELIEIYGYDKKILVSLAERVASNIQLELPPNHGFTVAEAEMYNNTNKNCQNILIRLLSYLYPKLKATEISAGTGDKIVFNISGTPDITTSNKDRAKVIPINGGQ